MKNKIFRHIVSVTGLLLFALGFIATKKNLPYDPCALKVQNWFGKKDTSITNHNFMSPYGPERDTVFCQSDTLYPVNWPALADSICKTYNDSCGRTGITVVIINFRDTARSTWTSRYGKIILTRHCP